MKKIKQGLVPKLRFREFEKDGEWEEKKLGEICGYSNGLSHENSVTEKGDYYLISLNSIDINGKLKPDMKRLSNTDNSLQKDDLIMVLSDVAHGNFLGLVDIIPNDRFVLNQRMARLRIKESDLADVRFLRTFINSNQKYFKANGQGSSQLNLSKSSVTDFAVLFPLISEQQKIADCLSSLDELIEAEDQKLEALQRHKKGLMQELFPADGETLPRLRFPEFQSAPEWEEKPFSNFIKLYRGSSPRPIQEFLTKNNDGVNWIKIGDTKFSSNFIIGKVEEKITKKGAERSRFVEIGELILANSMSYGKTYQLAINGCIYDGWFVLREYEDFFYKPFLLQLLNSDFMQKQYESLSAGGIVQNISSEVVYSSKLFHTSIPEQARIADFLTSVDDLITSQTKKLESLRLHKKGLMQQLFPNHNQEEIINHNKP